MRYVSGTTLCAIVLTTASCAVTPSSAESETEAHQAHSRLIDAYNTCNASAFTEAYAESFTFTTSNTRMAITTNDGLRAYLAAGCRQTPSPQVQLLSQAVRAGEYSAVATGQYMFRLSTGGKVSDVKQNYTLVMQRSANGWRIAAHHVSLSP